MVLGDGCIEEVGTYKELSSNPNSRFSAFLKTIAETSKASVDPVSSDTDVDTSEMDIATAEAGDEDALDYGGDEPDVTRVIRSSSDYPPRGSVSKRSSVRRLNSTDVPFNEEGEKGGALMTDEFKEREKGSVDRQVYISWAKAGGGVGVGVAILAMFVGVEGLNVTSKWWLTYWSQTGGSQPFFYLGIYALVNMSAILATFCRLFLFITAGLRASCSMFEELLDVVLQAPMSFFDT